jgi:hypothetical protein
MHILSPQNGGRRGGDHGRDELKHQMKRNKKKIQHFILICIIYLEMSSIGIYKLLYNSQTIFSSFLNDLSIRHVRVFHKNIDSNMTLIGNIAV